MVQCGPVTLGDPKTPYLSGSNIYISILKFSIKYERIVSKWYHPSLGGDILNNFSKIYNSGYDIVLRFLNDYWSYPIRCNYV